MLRFVIFFFFFLSEKNYCLRKKLELKYFTVTTDPKNDCDLGEEDIASAPFEVAVWVAVAAEQAAEEVPTIFSCLHFAVNAFVEGDLIATAPAIAASSAPNVSDLILVDAVATFVKTMTKIKMKFSLTKSKTKLKK